MNEEQRQWAIKRIGAKRGFWTHLTVYLAVNAILVVVWATGSAGSFWPIWPILGWGIGLVSHAVRVFGGHSGPSDERIDRELRNA